MGKHTKRHHRSGSLQQWAAAMIAHLGGLPSDEELAEPEPASPDDGWVNYDTLMQQRAGKAVRS